MPMIQRDRRVAPPPPSFGMPKRPLPVRAATAPVKLTGKVAHRGVRGTVRWTKKKPTERVPLLSLAGVWVGGELFHLTHVPPLAIAGAGAGLACAGYARVMHRHRSDDDKEALAFKAGAAIAGAALWDTIAAWQGATAGPFGMLSLGFVVLGGTGYVIYRLEDTVKDKIAWRNERADWHRLATQIGLRGSHLLESHTTRLGIRWVVSVKGTGKLASAIVGKSFDERIAQYYDLGHGRVSSGTDTKAGRIWISIRFKDPWASPVPHPLLDVEPELDLTGVCDITKPLIIGQDPETGQPIKLIVWTPDGAKRTTIVAATRGGKTTVINCILERVTASHAAVPWYIDVSVKGPKDPRRWRDARCLDLAALGTDNRKLAVAILELAVAAIGYRASVSTESVFVPGPGRPLIVLIIDEIDELVDRPDQLAYRAREALRRINSKGGSEGVAVVSAGQRGTAKWGGGADIRANYDQAIALKTNRQSEASHALGDMSAFMPNLNLYGGGHAGVLGITDFSEYDLGRSFKLTEFEEIIQIATGRTISGLEPGLVAHLDAKYQEAKAAMFGVERPSPEPPTAASAPSTEATATTEAEAPPADPLAALDADVEASLDPELRAEFELRMDGLRERNARTAKDLADLPAIPASTPAQRQASLHRLDQQAEQTIIPAKIREELIKLLASGTTVRKAVDALKTTGLETSRGSVWRFLNRLRYEGIIRKEGKGAKGQWVLAQPPATPPGTDGNGDAP